jgi:hypothetical protein
VKDHARRSPLFRLPACDVGRVDGSRDPSGFAVFVRLYASGPRHAQRLPRGLPRLLLANRASHGRRSADDPIDHDMMAIG